MHIKTATVNYYTAQQNHKTQWLWSLKQTGNRPEADKTHTPTRGLCSLYLQATQMLKGQNWWGGHSDGMGLCRSAVCTRASTSPPIRPNCGKSSLS